MAKKGVRGSVLAERVEVPQLFRQTVDDPDNDLQDLVSEESDSGLDSDHANAINIGGLDDSPILPQPTLSRQANSIFNVQ